MTNRETAGDINDSNSLRGRVFHQIRDNILSGKYKEHEELKEVAIGEEMGVSRTPVREAFRQLELEGLIKIIPNKGAYVTGITRKDVHDIYEMRSLLEGLCARWCCDNITQEQIDALEENIYLARFHTDRGNTEHLTALDNQFHDLLYEACGSKMLAHQLTDFHQYVIGIRRKTLSDLDRGIASNREHEEILNAIKNKDKDLAEKLAHAHMINAYNNILARGLDQTYPE